MTEKEKQQAGELYNAADAELTADRVKTKKFCVEYNALPCNDYRKKEWMLDRLLALRGEKTAIEADFYCDYGYNIVIGDNFKVGQNCLICDSAEVIFGDNVVIGPNCSFYTVEYPLDFASRAQGLERAKSIKVGSNVCIGGNVCVLPGVTIGDNVIIGAGSIVTEDIPSNTYAAGNPCKSIKALDIPPVPEKKEEPEEEEEKKPEKNAESPKSEKAPEKKVIKIVEVKDKK